MKTSLRELKTIPAPYNQRDDDTIKFAQITKDNEIELTWREMIEADDWDDITKEIDGETINRFLAQHLNIDLEEFYETGESSLMVDFEEYEGGYKITAPAGEYIIVSFEDLEDLAG